MILLMLCVARTCRSSRSLLSVLSAALLFAFGTSTAQGVAAAPTAPAASTPRANIPGTGFLPDHRGWEKISPANKNGGDVMADSQRVRIAADGSAANFASLAAFGDVVGTSVATDYMAVRGSSGWATHAITPPQAPLTVKPLLVALQSLYTGALSDDLSTGLFLGWSPVTPDPNVAKVANLYRRGDLKTPGTGSYQLVSACPVCSSSNTPLPALLGNVSGGGAPYFVGASSDYGHVIFESQQPLTGDAPAGCSDLTDLSQCPGNLYDWDHGTVRLAAILPDDACGSPPCVAPGSQAGQGAGSFQGADELTPHTISADGSRIFFTVPDTPGSQRGALYMRLDHTATVQLNASERVPLDPGGPQSGTYSDASSDGNRVFFTTSEALTDDAPVNGDNKLYVYDASKLDSDPHNLTLVSVDREPADGADVVSVLGTSSNGDYLYFGAAGQLVSGQPVLGIDRGIYVWHEGSIRYITSMQGFADNPEDTNTGDWVFARPTARVTPDGLHLLFSSTIPGIGPTGLDQGNCNDTSLDSGCRELYVYSADSDRMACASCNPSGAPAEASAFTAIRTNNGIAFTSSSQNHPISDDGRQVFFSTAEALVAKDVNGKVDVYEYDVPSGTLHLITSGRDRSDSYFMNASSSGSDVLFLTREQLISTDDDNNYDLYDARVDGGYTEPPPPVAACSDDACQGPQSSAPDMVTPASSLTSGTDNRFKAKIKPKSKARPKRCRKGYARKKIRSKTACVKKRKARKVKSARHPSVRRRTR